MSPQLVGGRGQVEPTGCWGGRGHVGHNLRLP